ncbi:MAG: hypothetical protein KI791_08275 [Cyclobacteriaceae bacterium]|nr:hypothetical protein [Cyclobacteriaceae bacterium SS2]
MKFIPLAIFSIFILASCADSQSPGKQILGKWNMEKVMEGDKNVSQIHNPEGNRWIKFNRNGSFETGGDPFGYNDGNWKLDDQLVLFLDSREENDDSEWRLSIAGDQMTWTGIGTPRQESFKLVHVRVQQE